MFVVLFFIENGGIYDLSGWLGSGGQRGIVGGFCRLAVFLEEIWTKSEIKMTENSKTVPV